MLVIRFYTTTVIFSSKQQQRPSIYYRVGRREVWISEDHLWHLVLLFHHMGSRESALAAEPSCWPPNYSSYLLATGVRHCCFASFPPKETEAWMWQAAWPQLQLADAKARLEPQSAGSRSLNCGMYLCGDILASMGHGWASQITNFI